MIMSTPFLTANERQIWISVSKLHLNLTTSPESPFVHMCEMEELREVEELQRYQRKKMSQAKRTLFTPFIFYQELRMSFRLSYANYIPPHAVNKLLEICR
ncbi:hypothetical protein VNO77_08100 [Canavalia gladiata]|uniref:Uncharacterized protein n=1 Tax=Canavalia gladiata TaxID=3824 RepID=A0AAN9MEX3_CANGL